MQNHRHNQNPYASCRHPQQFPTPIVPRDVESNKPLAMAYVPWQTWCNIYDAEKAFQYGTIFQELHLPFYGKGGVKR